MRGLSPGAQLVKAFNALAPEVLAAEPRQAGGRRVVFLSGDHLRAKIEVGRLVAQMGFVGIDLGGLVSGGKPSAISRRAAVGPQSRQPRAMTS